MNKIKLTFLVICICLLLAPNTLLAATLYFSPDSGRYGPGDSFAVDVKIDIDEDCVNTVEASIGFPNSLLKIENFIIGESILNIWIEKPSTADLSEINDKGVLYFAGGTPGGYCGKIPGDPGVSNVLGRIYFKVPGLIVGKVENRDMEVSFLSPTRALLNDGFGTEDNLVLKKSVFEFSPTPTGSKVDFREVLKEDTIAPEPFIIELLSDPSIYEGQYYIVFSTTDKQTGIDRYEVLEIRPGEEIDVAPEVNVFDKLLGRAPEAPAWKIARIPYLLNDQSLNSIIRVKAVDKAGNERIAEYIPPQPVAEIEKESPIKLIIIIIVLAISLIIVFTWLIIKILKKKKTSADSDTDADEKDIEK